MNKKLYFLIFLGFIALLTSTNDISADPTTPETLHVVIYDGLANVANGGIFVLQGSFPVTNPQIAEIIIDGAPAVLGPTDVAVDSDGNIIVISEFGFQLEKIVNPLSSSKSKQLISTGSDLPFGIFLGLAGVTVHDDGNIYTIDGGILEIVKVQNIENGSAEILSPTNTNNLLLSPVDITVDNSSPQNLIVLDAGDGISSSGRVISVNTQTGDQTLLYDGGFINPNSIAVAQNNDILVTVDFGVNKILRIVGLSSTEIAFNPSTNLVSGLAIDPLSGDIWFSDSANEGDPAIIGYDYPAFGGDKSFNSTLIGGPLKIDILHGLIPEDEIAAVNLTKSGPVTIDYVPNGNFTYTLTAANSGPASTNDMTIQDTLPNNLELFSSETRINGQLVTDGSNPKNLCIQIIQLVSCKNFGPINPNTIVEVKLNVNFTAPVSGKMTNKASVTSQNSLAGASFDTNVTNLSGDIGIISLSGNSPVIESNIVTYVITVQNKPGFATATNVIVNMTQNGIIVDSVTSSGASSKSCNNILPCDLGTIENAKQATITISGKIAPGALPEIENIVTLNSDFNDSNLSDNTKSIKTTIIRPPIFEPRPPQQVDELQELTINFTANDVNFTPLLPITYSITGAPVGSTFNTATGVFKWTPTELQGQDLKTITVNATGGAPHFLNNTQTVQITVNEVNEKPVFDPFVFPTNIDEMILFTFDFNATDPDLPPPPATIIPENTLTFSLVGAPPGATINPTTGIFSWNASEIQGQASYSFDVIVSDGGSPSLSDIKTVKVIVNEVNRPPILNPIPNQVAFQLIPFTFTATASDPDLPPPPATIIPENTLTFSLVGAPPGATINPTTGIFTWNPDLLSVPGLYPVTIIVTDGAGASDQQQFTIELKKSLREFKKFVGENIDDLKDEFAPLSKYTIKEIDKAVKHIEKSVEEKLWEDEVHLDPKHGKKVFHEEEKAVKSLMKSEKEADEKCKGVTSMILEYSGDVSPVKIIVTQKKNNPSTFTSVEDGDSITVLPLAGKDKLESNTNIKIFSGTTLIQETDIHTSCSKPIDEGDEYGLLEIIELETIPGKGKSKTVVPPGYDAAVQSIIDDLIEIDRTLAELAIDQASVSAGNPKVNKELAKANEEISKAEQSIIDRKFDKAIHHFEKAWKHAQNAIKHGS